MEQIISKYMKQYEVMATSANPELMHIFGENDKWAFKEMARLSPKTAQEWLEKNEAILWHNYLTKSEAEVIVAKFINQDRTKGAKWGYETFKNIVESLGGEISDEPFYNCYALWVTANMLYSDHAQSVAEDLGYKSASDVPTEKMALSMYKKAVEKLRDADKPRFVRWYFKV